MQSALRPPRHSGHTYGRRGTSLHGSPIPPIPLWGERFRLKADYDISKFSKENQIILKGLKKYGMMLTDNGAPWFIIGEPDKRWNDGDLGKLKTL